MSDTEYFAQRDEQKRQRAAGSVDMAIAAIHREIADRCRDRAGRLVGDRVSDHRLRTVR